MSYPESPKDPQRLLHPTIKPSVPLWLSSIQALDAVRLRIAAAENSQNSFSKETMVQNRALLALSATRSAKVEKVKRKYTRKSHKHERCACPPMPKAVHHPYLKDAMDRFEDEAKKTAYNEHNPIWVANIKWACIHKNYDETLDFSESDEESAASPPKVEHPYPVPGTWLIDLEPHLAIEIYRNCLFDCKEMWPEMFQPDAARGMARLNAILKLRTEDRVWLSEQILRSQDGTPNIVRPTLAEFELSGRYCAERGLPSEKLIRNVEILLPNFETTVL